MRYAKGYARYAVQPGYISRLTDQPENGIVCPEGAIGATFENVGGPAPLLPNDVAYTVASEVAPSNIEGLLLRSGQRIEVSGELHELQMTSLGEGAADVRILYWTET